MFVTAVCVLFLIKLAKEKEYSDINLVSAVWRFDEKTKNFLQLLSLGYTQLQKKRRVTSRRGKNENGYGKVQN